MKWKSFNSIKSFSFLSLKNSYKLEPAKLKLILNPALENKNWFKLREEKPLCLLLNSTTSLQYQSSQ
jgi:hypothetical protein